MQEQSKCAFPDGIKSNFDFGLLSLKGPDAKRFLQSQCTSDVNALASKQGQPSSLLDRKALIIAYFHLYCLSQEHYLLAAPKIQIEALKSHLDRFIFADKVEIVEEDFAACTLLSGETTALKVRNLTKNLGTNNKQELSLQDLIETDAGYILRLPMQSTDCFLFFSEEGGQSPALALPELDAEEIAARRVEAGYALLAVDYKDTLLVELSLASPAVSYTKGCFQGQEVLARVKAQGSPTRQLMGLVLDRAIDLAPMSEIRLAPGKESAGKESANKEIAGTIASQAYSPRLQKHLALAFLKRDLRVPGRKLEISTESGPVTGEVTTLPFIENKSDADLAKVLFDQALDLFTRQNDTEQAIERLEEALYLNPAYEDAFEALGVILSKHENTEGYIDKAISVMEKLVALNPDSIMAHANLSVFYLEKGDKEKAEEEKATSMSIRMREAAKLAMQEKKEKEDKEALIKESQERIKMFLQVLEIDTEDLFANQGLGNCYNILGEFEKAEEYLQKAIAIKPNHTQCYEDLAAALAGQGKIKEAVSAYQKGIEVAAQKGDMQPLKRMKEKLLALEAKSPV
ncbi:MAG: tetratricopeptide repeat protein [Candidatus Obscuribacter phosphatis]|uniref:Tetratricopeptide repeat protein n=1 Tax=Candidatus Obscuribacter phosphatis TaxID=1906157 RepID=A0A8J7TMG3_9BACT|nr:tetratricopeptide repeat protein [Candidatus Obscuribacter phosphatis]